MKSDFDDVAVGGTGPLSAAVGRRRHKLPLGMMALEPRLMYDGAAATTAAHAAADAAAKALIPAVAAPVEVQAADASKDGGKKEVTFVDTSLSNWQQLVADLQASKPGMAIELIDGGKDGLAQMAVWAESNSGYDAIHVLSHGAEGQIELGTDIITDSSLSSATIQAELAEIGHALNAGGDLLIYGCDVAAGTDGQQLITDLAADTGANVAASTDATGATDLGGNWTLEAKSGVIDVAALGLTSYESLLSSGTVTFSDGDNGTYNLAGVSSFTETIGGVTFTFSVGNDAYFHVETNGWSTYGLYALDGGANGNDVKVTITIQSGYTFDLSAFSFEAYSSSNPITVSFISGGVSYTDTFTTSIDGALVTETSFTNPVHNVSSLSLSANDYAIFQNLVFVNIRPPSTVAQITGTDTVTTIADNTTTSPFSGLTYVDTNGPSYHLTITYTAADGTLSGSGLTGSAGNYTLTGTSAADITAKLEALLFTPTTNQVAVGNTVQTTFTLSPSDVTGEGAGPVDNGTVITVTSVNDAPTLSSSGQTLASEQQSDSTVPTTSSQGTAISSLVSLAGNVTDSDPGAVTGIAITSLDTSHGSWYYYNGTTWTLVSSVSATNALLLTASDRLYFKDDGTYAGILSNAVTFAAWDQTSGTHGNYVNASTRGGTTAFSSATASASLTVADNVAPSAPSMPTLTAASDSGISSTDHITDVTTPTFTGTAEANATVTLYDGATLIGTTTADGSGNWSITSTTLASGSHTVTAKATDVAGNISSASSGLSVSIDTTAPSVSSDVRVGTTPTNGSSEQFTVTFSENVTGVDATDFTVSTTGTVISTGISLTQVSATVYTVTITGISGSGTLRLDLNGSGTGITDAAGNAISSGYTSGQTYTIDTIAPSSPSTPDLNSASDSGSSSTDNITNVTTPTFTGTAEANATVTLYDGATVLGTTAVDGSGNWSITSSTLASGSHTITAKATDAAGNVSASSSGLAVTIDTIAPSAPSTPDLATASDSGSSSTDNVTNIATPVFTGTAEANATITLYDGATLIGTGTADGSGNWSITSSTLASGSHTISAKATDAAGNVSTASSGLAVTIDTIAPSAPSTPDLATASDSGSSSTDNVTNIATPVFTGTAEANATITLYDGTTAIGTATANGSGNWSITSSTLASGSHTITAKATDAAGNVSTASSGLAVTIDTIAPVAASISAPAVTSTGGTSYSFDVVFSDSGSGIESSTIDLTNVTVTKPGGGTLTVTSVTWNAATHTATYTVQPPSSTWQMSDAGTYTIAIVASQVTDLAGNSVAANASAATFVVGFGPIVSAGHSSSFSEGGSAVVIDSSLTLSDPNSSTITSATVTISSGFLSGDTLGFIAQNGISGSYNASTGMLTLSGTASLANYQAALASVTFSTASHNPSNYGADTSRTVSWTVDDGQASNNIGTGTTTVSIATTDDAPTLTGAGNTASYTEAGGAATLSSAITVGDLDNQTLAGATISISSGFRTGDTLGFTAQNGISGSYNASTGVLTLSGSASLANYQAALDSITFSSSSQNPTNYGADTSRTIIWTVNDGSLNSTAATSGVTVTAVDNAPSLGGAGNTASYTEAGSAVALSPGITASDVDNQTLSGATISISSGFLAGDILSFTNQNGIAGSYNTSTGVLTLTGSASLANYQTALDSVTFSSSSQNPTNYGADTSRTISWTANDGSLASTTVTSGVSITAVNNAPSLSGGGVQTNYAVGGGAVTVDAAISTSDADNQTLASATVSISGGFVSGDALATNTTSTGITASYNASTGVLTLTGSDTLAHYQQVLDAITFQTTSSVASTRTISWTANDGSLNSTVATTSVTLTNGPTLSGAGNTVSYTEQGAATVIDAGLTVGDANATLTGAVVSISSGLTTGDRLNFSNQNGIIGSYDAASGILTLSGTASVANYQAALASVTFSSTSHDPTLVSATRTISWTASDATATSPAVASTVAVTAVNDAAVISLPTSLSVGDTQAHALPTPIQISDADARSGTETVTVAASKGGTLHVDASIAGLTVSGNGSAAITLSGSLSALNSALAGLTYQAQSLMQGSDSLTVTVNDQGNSGGPARTASGSIAVTIVAPTATPPTPVEAIMNTDVTTTTTTPPAVQTSAPMVTNIHDSSAGSSNGLETVISTSSLNTRPTGMQTVIPSSSETVVPPPPPPVILTPLVATSTPAGGGLSVMVISDPQHLGLSEVVVARPIGQVTAAGGRVDFTLPADAFAVTQANMAVTLTAVQADGRPLPSWLKFNPSTGKFEGTAPPGARSVEIRVTARDGQGHQAVQIFRLTLTAERADAGTTEKAVKQASATGRAGLSEQLRAMGRDGRMAKIVALIGGRAA